ncbi:MAG: DUF29 domain-containing protein [Leptolyngbyaceae cyanobacterium RU_5_1]|nr:DUF29 domain-containing protein [Leptolyngbyaceae cyanobacterium RU_5_1]
MNIKNTAQNLATLYDADFAKWIDKTVQLLKERQFAELDLENLIEEVESLVRSDKREIRSRLIKLLSHLLKYAYQPENRSTSWISTIVEQRRQIILILEDSPSLRNYLSENYAGCYVKAMKEAADETGLAIATFPEQCPFAEADVLTESWLP